MSLDNEHDLGDILSLPSKIIMGRSNGRVNIIDSYVLNSTGNHKYRDELDIISTKYLKYYYLDKVEIINGNMEIYYYVLEKKYQRADILTNLKLNDILEKLESIENRITNLEYSPGIGVEFMKAKESFENLVIDNEKNKDINDSKQSEDFE